MIFRNKIGWYAQPGSVRHDFYINDEIGEASEYNELLQCLSTATPVDVIYIHLNTPGGSFLTACQICDAMLTSQAGAIVACAEGLVASAGTLIFLAATGWHVSELSTFMFHTSGVYESGKMPDAKKSLLAHEEHLQRVTSILYTPFFSEEEVADIIDNSQDVWLTPTQVAERLKIMADIIEKEQESAANEMTEELESQIEDEIEARVAERLLELSDKGDDKTTAKPKRTAPKSTTK